MISCQNFHANYVKMLQIWKKSPNSLTISTNYASFSEEKKINERHFFKDGLKFDKLCTVLHAARIRGWSGDSIRVSVCVWKVIKPILLYQVFQ